MGNIKATGKVSMFLIDYPSQQRLKIWAEARIVAKDEDPELLAKVSSEDYQAVVERVIVFSIQAYDWNCPQHITPRFTHEEISAKIKELDPDLIRSCCPDEVDGK